jgi:hypothetical protein
VSRSATVCFKDDDFTEELQTERGVALWRATLSDGSNVVMDDHRFGLRPHSAWLRLREYVAERNLWVTSLGITFRSHRQLGVIPDDADGYFFCKSSLGSFGERETLAFYLIGSLTGGKLVVQQWQVPELVYVGAEERDPTKSGPCLIVRPGVQL